MGRTGSAVSGFALLDQLVRVLWQYPCPNITTIRRLSLYPGPPQRSTMGYTTDFCGFFEIAPELAPEHRAYLDKFNQSRRMKRDAEKTALLSDPLREAVGLPVGEEGGYFVGAPGFMGQDRTDDVLDYNSAPAGQPGLWCQWRPNEDGESCLEWDRGEKFYDYVAWLEYLIEHFFKPWGYTLKGRVEWRGEEWDDTGVIQVENNIVEEWHADLTPASSWEEGPPKPGLYAVELPSMDDDSKVERIAVGEWSELSILRTTCGVFPHWPTVGGRPARCQKIVLPAAPPPRS